MDKAKEKTAEKFGTDCIREVCNFQQHFCTHEEYKKKYGSYPFEKLGVITVEKWEALKQKYSKYKVLLEHVQFKIRYAKERRDVEDREKLKQIFNNVKSHYYTLFDDVRNFTINEEIDKK